MVFNVIVTCGLSLGVLALNTGPLLAVPPNNAPTGGTVIVSPTCVLVAPDGVSVRVHEPQDDGNLVFRIFCPLGDVP